MLFFFFVLHTLREMGQLWLSIWEFFEHEVKLADLFCLILAYYYIASDSGGIFWNVKIQHVIEILNEPHRTRGKPSMVAGIEVNHKN